MRATPINNTRGGAVTALLPFTLSIFPFSSTTFPSLIPRRSFGLLFRFEFTGARGESRWKDTTTRPPIIPLSTLAVHSTTRINSSRDVKLLPSFSLFPSVFATRKEKVGDGQCEKSEGTVTHKCRSINLTAIRRNGEFDFATIPSNVSNDSPVNATLTISFLVYRYRAIPFSTLRSPSLQI